MTSFESHADQPGHREQCGGDTATQERNQPTWGLQGRRTAWLHAHAISIPFKW